MSIDFATLQGLTIPEGVVTQITDASGNVLWSAGGKDVILEVEKITSNTYASETLYEGEQFILLDIYPKTNGTVSVTYGGLTKTITDTSGAESPNAQQVFFGTFNGVSDSVTTPDSGTLTIEGDCRTFAIGYYTTSAKGALGPCSCITAIAEWGDVTQLPANALYSCTKLSELALPANFTSIGGFAFMLCNNLVNVVFNDGLKSIGEKAFAKTATLYTTDWGAEDLPLLNSLVLPASLEQLGDDAFCVSVTEKVAGATSYYDYPPCQNITLLTTNPPTLFRADTESTSDFLPFGKIVYIDSITVPKGSKEIYNASETWSYYSSVIVEASE